MINNFNSEETDLIFAIRMCLEKCYEYKITTQHLFVDYNWRRRLIVQYLIDTQYLAYAENLAIVDTKQEDIESTLRILAAESGKAGLKINEGKTKYILINSLKIGSYIFERDNINALETIIRLVVLYASETLDMTKKDEVLGQTYGKERYREKILAEELLAKFKRIVGKGRKDPKKAQCIALEKLGEK
ncbi:hypothetical protein CWI38_1060p0020 [Hamiltosporidium tvaerminnensis]|uniref:Reverse transcriptase domain-containing protein n=1 Tax=Hamiltosporidium tvaerminnensis TaxID=1176355 RepID=A0A4Q9LVU4_9MICR|nr:hypothetical protein CWI38_1060p0020 [Hamiltosporidium tvaerminnensis]